MRHTPLTHSAILRRADPSVARRIVEHLDRLGQQDAEDAAEGLVTAVDLILGAITLPRDQLPPALRSDIDARLAELADYLRTRSDADEESSILIGLDASRVALKHWADDDEARKGSDPNAIANAAGAKFPDAPKLKLDPNDPWAGIRTPVNANLYNLYGDKVGLF